MSTIFEVCHDEDRALAVQSERMLQQAEAAADPKPATGQVRPGRPQSGFRLVRLVTSLFAGGNR